MGPGEAEKAAGWRPHRLFVGSTSESAKLGRAELRKAELER